MGGVTLEWGVSWQLARILTAFGLSDVKEDNDVFGRPNAACKRYQPSIVWVYAAGLNLETGLPSHH